MGKFKLTKTWASGLSQRTEHAQAKVKTQIIPTYATDNVLVITMRVRCVVAAMYHDGAGNKQTNNM